MTVVVIEQASKDRLVSGAKGGGRNEAVKEIENIRVPSVDFVPACIRGLVFEIRISPLGGRNQVRGFSIRGAARPMASAQLARTGEEHASWRGAPPPRVDGATLRQGAQSSVLAQQYLV